MQPASHPYNAGATEEGLMNEAVVSSHRHRRGPGPSLQRTVAALCLCALAAIAWSPGSASAQVPFGGIYASAPAGLNLSQVNYYSTQVPFEDVFRNRDDWQFFDQSDVEPAHSQDVAAARAIPRDATLYPLQVLATDRKLRAYTFFPVYPTYTDPNNSANNIYYRVTFSGSGTLSFGGPGLTSQQISANEYRLQVPRSLTDPVWVQIETSSAANHVTNIQITQNKSITQDFGSMISGFRVLRFMDWGRTNDNPVTKWSPTNSSDVWTSRTLPGQPEGTERGVAIETMIATANQYKTDLWYNIPHQADNTFIANAAQLIANTLDPSLKVYVEYSNENWNGIFSQAQWEAQQGLAMHFNTSEPYSGTDDGANYWAGLKYSVYRAAKAHQIFRQTVGKSRVVAVLAGQSDFTDLNRTLLQLYRNPTYNPLWTNLVSGVPSDTNAGPPDVLAVAPYVDVHFTTADTSLSETDIMNRAFAVIPTLVGANTRTNFGHAQDNGARLVAYESGQHLLAVEGAESDPTFVQKLINVNRSAGMAGVYRQAIRAWIDNGGGLNTHFNSCENPSKYGTWGALEYQDQPVSTAPKMVALREAQSAPDRVVAIYTKINSRYATANNSGATTIINDRTAIGGWERFLLHMNTDGTYSLKAMVNGFWVSADFNAASPNTGALIANRDTIGPWEKFDLVATTDGYLALRLLDNRKYVTFSSTGTGNAYASATTISDGEKLTFVSTNDHVAAFLTRSNMRYVTAENAGANPVLNRALVLDNWERFQIVTNPDQSLGFMALVNNMYLSGGSGGGNPLIANQTSVGASEKFHFIPNVDGTFAIRSQLNYKFITFDPAGTVNASARASVIGDWEKVSFSQVPERQVVLRAKSNGRYVTANNAGSSPLINNATAIGGWERFALFMNSDSTVSLRSLANQMYVCADNNGTSPLIANRTSIGTWEKFQLGSTSDGYVTLRSMANNKYVTFSSAGTTSAIAGAQTVGDWEKITLSDQ